MIMTRAIRIVGLVFLIVGFVATVNKHLKSREIIYGATHAVYQQMEKDSYNRSEIRCHLRSVARLVWSHTGAFVESAMLMLIGGSLAYVPVKRPDKP